MSWDRYDRPFLNVSGETIPPFAVMQFDGWDSDADGLAVFRARKPDGNGKVYLINGPSSVPVRNDSARLTGIGLGTIAHGAYALFDEELTPELNQELGPVADQWHLGDGSGFFVMGDVQGSGSSPPGFPSVPSSFRVRVVMQPSDAPDNIILGRVLSDVTLLQPTFVIVNVIALEGPDPTEGNPLVGVLIQNVPPVERAAGDYVRAKKSSTNGLWFPDFGTSTGPPDTVYGELKADKGYADVAVLAGPVIVADGLPPTAPAEFFFLDFPPAGEDAGRFWGLAPYTDAGSGTEHPGYHYFGVRVDDDYLDSGKPAYRIVDGEGPADFLLVTLTTTVSQSTFSADCNLLDVRDPAGGPDAARFPRIESASYDIEVYDDYIVADEAAINDRWVVKWDRLASHYVFWRPLDIDKATIPLIGMLTDTLPAATYTATAAGYWEVTLGTAANSVTIMEFNAGRTGLQVQEITPGVPRTRPGLWRGKTPLRASATEPLLVVGHYEDIDLGSGLVQGFLVDSEWDARGGAGYVHTSDQAYQKGANETPAWENTEECD